MSVREGHGVLAEFKPAKDYFIGIDSDGCVFDTMEIKHKECFAPMFVKHFGLQAVSKYAREVWEFVNLYSKSRGVNRFPALSLSLNILRQRPQVVARKVPVPETAALDARISREPALTNSTLKKQIEGGDTALQQVMDWSLAVNRMIEDMVHDVPPFPLFRESLAKMNAKADVIVVSQTPTEALEREWAEHEIRDQVRLIAGQELGSKSEHLQLAAQGKYEPGRMLMIGDAPGDLKAARAAGALFFPVNPGAEEKSWERLLGEGLERFFAGSFAGDYEAGLIREFDGCLPEKPAWDK
jgi:phosphoglycolate phosphatase-like HAD superfamily hydrolase